MPARTLSGWVLLTAGVLLASVPAAAAERDAGALHYEARERTITKFATKALWNAAKAAREDGLHWQCNDLCGRILTWQPDHAPAREHLGWRRKDGRWVLDEKAAAEVVRTNTWRSGEDQDAFWERVGEWRRRYVTPAEREVAKRFVKLGAECERRRWPVQAVRAFHAAIAFDPDAEEPRRRLGLVSRDELWLPASLTAAYDGVRTTEAATREEAWEEALGVRLPGRQTPRVRVVATSHQDDLDYVARAGEVACLLSFDLLGLDHAKPLFGGKRMRFVLVDTDHWRQWMSVHRDEDKSLDDAVQQNSEGRRTQGWYSNHWREWDDRVDLADLVAHEIAEMVLRRAYGAWRAKWVYESFAQVVAARTVPIADARCFGSKSTRYGESEDEESWKGSPMWRRFVRELVFHNDDLALRGLLSRKSDSMTLEESVKAWSVMEWLLAQHPGPARSFIARADRKADQVALLATLFGRTPEELDEEWRAYVLRAY